MSKRTITVRTVKGVASFRRCGIDFSRNPQTVEVDDSDADRIEAETSMLEVLEATEEEDGDDVASDSKGAKGKRGQGKRGKGKRGKGQGKPESAEDSEPGSEGGDDAGLEGEQVD